MSTYVEGSPLTQVEAEIRSRQIKQVDYRLRFRLPEADSAYTGQVDALLKIASDASKLSDEIFMEFAGGEVLSVTLNDKPIAYTYAGARIKVASQKFKVGENTLGVAFKHPYGESGFGFHRTCDKADGKYYVYSDFEPYNANQAFPVFDQPDLKATYTLTVDAPSDWQVIANTHETSVKPLEGATVQQWVFPASERFSTYLFALVAGPFKKWENRTEGGTPLRLFARKSMEKFLAPDVDHWFAVTREGFHFFEKAFAYPYPFHKYDQILTPDYNHGAMENVGAVTFTEKYIFRTPPTPTRSLRRVETIIHELAHMWFGNLVTMKWWDDLWLNESFATYASNLAMANFQTRQGLANVWQQFNAENKAWAYREDDAVTTHPIVGVVPNTDEALANFDGITYGKGAAALKQLVRYIGEGAFLKGLQSYFKKYAFSNATREQFMQELSVASGRDLAAWDDLWLKTSGTNSVKVTYAEKDGKITRLSLEQRPDEVSRILRPHQTDVGLYDLDVEGRLVLRETFGILYSTKNTDVPAAQGKKVPQFIFPNVGDHDFVKVVLDNQSLSTLDHSLSKIQDPHLRQMLWSTLWDMVRHAQLPAQRFIRIAMNHLREESDIGVLENGLSFLTRAPWYAAATSKAKVQGEIETFLAEFFDRVEASSPRKILLFGQYLGQVRSAAGLKRIQSWLNQVEVVPGFAVDQERRWAILTRLASQGITGVMDLLHQERERDKNDLGLFSAMVGEAALPESRNKKVWWSRLLGRDADHEKLSIEKSRRIMGVFHDDDRPEVTKFLEEEFFHLLPKVGNLFPPEFNSSLAALLYPVDCSDRIDARVEKLLADNPDLPVGVRRELKKNRQLHERTRAARLFDSGSN